MTDGGRRNPGVITVLVIDDHAMVAESLRRVLSSFDDIEVVGVAQTAAAGVEAARSLRPNVVLLDYQLPDADGLITASRIRSDSPESAVLMLTGGADPDLAVRAVQAGCSGLIGKGGDIDELVEGVRRSYAAELVLSPAIMTRLLPWLGRDREEPKPALSHRELAVLGAMAEGKSDKDIAVTLSIAPGTARKHVHNILRKLGAHSKLEAVVVATRAGVIRPPRPRASRNAS